MRARRDLDVVAMLTMFDEDETRSRSHGLRPDVLSAQADRLGLRQVIGRCTWQTYDAAFSAALDTLRDDGISYVVFGDIVFAEHRQWAEDRCRPHGLIAVEPLFGTSTTELFLEWVNSGSEAVIVTVRTTALDASWLGRTLSRDMLADFVHLGVDPCGERGEYHTVVTRTPLFREPLLLSTGACVERSDCVALDVIPAASAAIISP
jgi:uncharacterized protein (TIGR00290 family)